LNTGQAAVPAVYSQISSLIRENAQHLSLEESYVARILNVYEDAFNERVKKQQAAFARIEVFEHSVNRFLQGKKLHVRGHDRRFAPGPAVGTGMITLPNGRTASLNALSSGERQVMTLLFSATHLSSYDGLVLIDEPELSLHVGWQRIILDELRKQAEDRQIVVCTHAPEITADHRERTVRFAPTIWRAQEVDVTDAVDTEIDVI
jgi:predicted ATPase